jgi:hypothetical protein
MVRFLYHLRNVGFLGLTTESDWSMCRDDESAARMTGRDSRALQDLRYLAKLARGAAGVRRTQADQWRAG